MLLFSIAGLDRSVHDSVPLDDGVDDDTFIDLLEKVMTLVKDLPGNENDAVVDPGCPKALVCRLIAQQLGIDVESAEGAEWPFDTSGYYFLVHGKRERPFLIGPDGEPLLIGVHDIVPVPHSPQAPHSGYPPSLPPPSPLKRIIQEEQPFNQLGRAFAACFPCCRFGGVGLPGTHEGLAGATTTNVAIAAILMLIVSTVVLLLPVLSEYDDQEKEKKNICMAFTKGVQKEVWEDASWQRRAAPMH
ncbi:unnamed protein product [Vitrella brassicaformis CCMP3155]|uniref:Uncharacterized protein n=1 Tax=Vitrella brassicaformis (strain CCMP3155) TaxID=1169540 RepID=A0A0G4H477_VITBC|nr:unnamed protein product [Vitrella brassicaformis CCMP3155]|eukprot:CEM38561.1 unnamed protein product [Vitrella brassicaformis CCMP3155]